MQKKLLVALCVLTLLTSTTPIFAAQTNNQIVLTPDQLSKLSTTQTKLNDLMVKIDNLLTNYKNTKQTKGLLNTLQQYKKQANKLNHTISNYTQNPTGNADKKINSYLQQESQLAKKVNLTEKILVKTTNKIILTPDQLAKLSDIQNKITDLVAKIENLKTTYQDTNHTQGQITALNQFEKQAKKLNNTVINYTKNPSPPANTKIKTFLSQEIQLENKVNRTEKVLIKKNTTQ